MMSIPKNNTCPLCKLPLREYHDFLTCSTCQTSYHEKCWQENGGCTLCDVIAGSSSSTPVRSFSWYLYHDNKNLGPLTWEQLCSHPGIQPDDLVWNNRLPDWIRADQVPNLPLGGGLPGNLQEKTEEPGETDKEAALPETVEHPAAVPAPSGSAPRWKPGGAGYRFSPEPAREPEPGETDRDEALPATEAHPAGTPAPGSSPQGKLGGAGRNHGTPAGEQPGERTENPPRDPSRTEQIINRLYTEQPPGPPSSYSFLDRQEDYFDERAEMARGYARHVIYGILLVLGGLIAAAATYFYAAEWVTVYYAVACGVILFGVIDFFRGLFGWLKYRS
jgi:hypothetical protein